MCIRMTPASERCKTSIIAGSARKAEMSLTISAPAARAWRAVSALYVSIDKNRSGNRLRRRLTTGMTRRSSSSTGTGSDPGRDDSPPTSRMTAPSPAIRSACRNAASSSMNWPPSEKESGVTFKTPITRPEWLRSTERVRSFQIMRHTHCVRHRLASSFAFRVRRSPAKHARSRAGRPWHSESAIQTQREGRAPARSGVGYPKNVQRQYLTCPPFSADGYCLWKTVVHRYPVDEEQMHRRPQRTRRPIRNWVSVTTPLCLSKVRNGARETREKTRKGMRGVGWEAHVTSRDPTLDAVGTRSCAIRRGMSKKRATAIFDLSLRVGRKAGRRRLAGVSQNHGDPALM